MKGIFKKLYNIYILGLMVSINLFFFVFVHNKYDLSPNVALFCATVPVIIIQLLIIFRRKRGGI
jgi:hypothetical protein